jgi:hypothetical protein
MTRTHIIACDAKRLRRDPNLHEQGLQVPGLSDVAQRSCKREKLVMPPVRKAADARVDAVARTSDAADVIGSMAGSVPPSSFRDLLTRDQHSDWDLGRFCDDSDELPPRIPRRHSRGRDQARGAARILMHLRDSRSRFVSSIRTRALVSMILLGLRRVAQASGEPVSAACTAWRPRRPYMPCLLLISRR